MNTTQGFLVILLLMVVMEPRACSETEFFVAPGGSDTWSGTKPAPVADGVDGPFATLERARDAIRHLKQSHGLPEDGIVVWLRGGDYVRTASFELTAEDSGARECPISYRAFPGESVRLLGGCILRGFEPVTDPVVLERLPACGRGAVVQADLKEQGITDYGSLKARGFGRSIQPGALELFFDGEPMTRARWPNGEWARIASVPEGSQGVFLYEGDRPDRWADVEDIWLHGYWTWDWAESRERIRSIDTTARRIETHPPHGVYGYKAGARYYAENILEELDEPGEYYVDARTGLLYFWPPASVENVEAAVSLLEAPFVTMDGVAHVTIRGVTFECSRGPGVTLRGGAWNRIAGCTFANIGTLGVYIGALMTDADRQRDVDGGVCNGVIGCDFRNLGEGGVVVYGGDRRTLTPGSNYVVNNDFGNYSYFGRTYRPAVQVCGVRNRVAHNHIHDAPHMGIGLSGNEHIIEFNRIHHVCMETSDAGAFYMGRDWTWRQNVVRFNFFHDLGRGDVQAVYLDDWASATLVYGNVFYKAGRGVLLGGGRDTVIENNIFVECTPAVHIDQRGLGWARNYFTGDTNTLFERLYAVNADMPPYTLRYPQLITLVQDQPAHAKYNHVLRNVCVGGRWLDLRDNLQASEVDMADNWTEGDPGFVDAANLDFRLRDDSPVYERGFQRIPFERIGLYEDEYRRELRSFGR